MFVSFYTPAKEPRARNMDSYTSIPLKKTESCKNYRRKIIFLYDYIYDNVQVSAKINIRKRGTKVVLNNTSLWSCSNMGVLDIGEKPKAGIPSCLMYRVSVVEDSISGFASFPPAASTARLNTNHQGFESSVLVISGCPL